RAPLLSDKPLSQPLPAPRADPGLRWARHIPPAKFHHPPYSPSSPSAGRRPDEAHNSTPPQSPVPLIRREWIPYIPGALLQARYPSVWLIILQGFYRFSGNPLTNYMIFSSGCVKITIHAKL